MKTIEHTTDLIDLDAQIEQTERDLLAPNGISYVVSGLVVGVWLATVESEAAQESKRRR